MLLIRTDTLDSKAIQIYSERSNGLIVWCVFPSVYYSDNTNKIKMILDQDDKETVKLYVDCLSGKTVIASMHIDALTELGLSAGDIVDAPFLLQASWKRQVIDQIIEQKIND